MQQLEIAVPPSADLAAAEAQIQGACLAEGLKIALKTSLASYPGSVHWHLKSGTGAGTLEVTLWPAARRLWLAIHRGRDAPWVEPAAARLGATLENDLASAASGSLP